MADQTQRLEIATVKAEIASDIISRFSNDAVVDAPIPTDSGDIQNLKQVIVSIQEEGAEKISFATTIYPTTAAGIAATTDGAIFLVKSAEADEIYTVWQNVAGAATDTSKRALSAQAIQEAMTAADTSADEAAASALEAQEAATNAAAEFETIFDADQAQRTVEFNEFLQNTQYEVAVPYASGLSIARATQTVLVSGIVYRPIAGALPFVTTTFAAESAKWAVLGDGALRQDLTGPDGAEIVHFQGSPLPDFLQELTPSPTSSKVRLLDMQYGALLGTPFVPTETGGEVKYNLVSAYAVGATSVQVVSATGLLVGQLVCFVSTSGRYFSNQIKGIVGSTLSLMKPLAQGVNSGENLFNFYNNASHPNVYGYRTITDSVIDTDRGHAALSLVNNISALATGTSRYSLSSGTTISGSSPIGVSSPSDSTDLAPIFSPGTALAITFPVGTLENGPHVVEVLCRKSGVAGPINFSLSSGTPVFTDNGTVSIAQSDETMQVVRLFFSGTAEPASLAVVGVDSVIIKYVRVFKVESALRKLTDHRKIVMLGDSWFAQTGIFQRLTQNYPHTNIVNKGIGGNTAAHLYARFDADVTSQNPDAVIIVCGTNDYFGSVSSRLFNWQMQRLIAKCAAIGAECYVLTSSVGDDSDARLDLSRQYASLQFVGGVIASADSTVKYTVRVSIPYVSVPSGGSVTVLVGKAIAGSAPKLKYANGDFSATKTMAVGVGSNVTLATSLSGTIITAPTGVPDFSFDLPSTRWIFARLVNTGGSAEIYGGYVVIETSNTPLQ